MTYEFGPFRYDAGQRLLFRGGDLVPLVPKAIETLHVLLERRGFVVEKSELMKLVWPDTNVEDVGLARNISLLRKALEDESEENPYIETIPRRGYRFAAQVSTAEPANVPPPETEPRQPSRRRWRLFTLPVCALAAGAFVYYSFMCPPGICQKATGPPAWPWFRSSAFVPVWMERVFRKGSMKSLWPICRN